MLLNAKINKVTDDIEKTKAKIAELQALLPELERKRTDMENTEIIKLLRSADIAPADIPDFINKVKASGTNLPNLATLAETAKTPHPSEDGAGGNFKPTDTDDNSDGGE